MRPTNSRWLINLSPDQGKQIRLFCFPHAGGNSSDFREWPQHFSDSIGLVAIQPPGRSRRFLEQAIDDFDIFVDQIVEAMACQMDIPYATFGHSLGAFVSVEVTKRLLLRGFAPSYVFFSGASASFDARQKNRPSDYSDDQLIDYLRELNSVSEDALNNRELMGLLLPSLRADFRVADSINLCNQIALPCPVHAFGGEAEHSAEDLLSWAEQSSKSFSMDLLPGGHFFTVTARARLLATIRNKLEFLLGP